MYAVTPPSKTLLDLLAVKQKSAVHLFYMAGSGRITPLGLLVADNTLQHTYSVPLLDSAIDNTIIT